MRDVLGGLARSGLTNVCIQAFHSENAALGWEAADLAVADHPGLKVRMLEHAMPALSEAELGEIFGDSFGAGARARRPRGDVLMLAVRPDLVLQDRMVDDAAARRPGWDVLPAPPGVRAGDRRALARVEEQRGGRAMMLDRAVARLVEALTTEFGTAPATTADDARRWRRRRPRRCESLARAH